ncbi:hypothetical protein AX16_005049 [Volvariella volvacea WC 439]|nr:hypothetical protein AX16_005049 [Volvariella volvacea WC 439]
MPAGTRNSPFTVEDSEDEVELVLIENLSPDAPTELELQPESPTESRQYAANNQDNTESMDISDDDVEPVPVPQESQSPRTSVKRKRGETPTGPSGMVRPAQVPTIPPPPHYEGKKARKRRRRAERLAREAAEAQTRLQASQAVSHFQTQPINHPPPALPRNQLLRNDAPTVPGPVASTSKLHHPLPPNPLYFGNAIQPSANQVRVSQNNIRQQPKVPPSGPTSAPRPIPLPKATVTSTSNWVNSMARAAEQPGPALERSEVELESLANWPSANSASTILPPLTYQSPTATANLGPSAPHSLPVSSSTSFVAPNARGIIGRKAEEDLTNAHGFYHVSFTTTNWLQDGPGSPKKVKQYHPRPDRSLVMEKLPKACRTVEYVWDWAKRASVVVGGGVDPVFVSVDPINAKALIEFVDVASANRAWSSPRLSGASGPGRQKKGKGEDAIRVWWYRPHQDDIGMEDLSSEAVDQREEMADKEELEEGEIESDEIIILPSKPKSPATKSMSLSSQQRRSAQPAQLPRKPSPPTSQPQRRPNPIPLPPPMPSSSHQRRQSPPPPPPPSRLPPPLPPPAAQPTTAPLPLSSAVPLSHSRLDYTEITMNQFLNKVRYQVSNADPLSPAFAPSPPLPSAPTTRNSLPVPNARPIPLPPPPKAAMPPLPLPLPLPAAPAPVQPSSRARPPSPEIGSDSSIPGLMMSQRTSSGAGGSTLADVNMNNSANTQSRAPVSSGSSTSRTPTSPKARNRPFTRAPGPIPLPPVTKPRTPSVGASAAAAAPQAGGTVGGASSLAGKSVEELLEDIGSGVGTANWRPARPIPIPLPPVKKRESSDEGQSLPSGSGSGIGTPMAATPVAAVPPSSSMSISSTPPPRSSPSGSVASQRRTSSLAQIAKREGKDLDELGLDLAVERGKYYESDEEEEDQLEDYEVGETDDVPGLGLLSQQEEGQEEEMKEDEEIAIAQPVPLTPLSTASGSLQQAILQNQLSAIAGRFRPVSGVEMLGLQKQAGVSTPVALQGPATALGPISSSSPPSASASASSSAAPVAAAAGLLLAPSTVISPPPPPPSEPRAMRRVVSNATPPTEPAAQRVQVQQAQSQSNVHGPSQGARTPGLTLTTGSGFGLAPMELARPVTPGGSAEAGVSAVPAPASTSTPTPMVVDTNVNASTVSVATTSPTITTPAPASSGFGGASDELAKMREQLLKSKLTRRKKSQMTDVAAPAPAVSTSGSAAPSALSGLALTSAPVHTAASTEPTSVFSMSPTGDGNAGGEGEARDEMNGWVVPASPGSYIPLPPSSSSSSSSGSGLDVSLVESPTMMRRVDVERSRGVANGMQEKGRDNGKGKAVEPASSAERGNNAEAEVVVMNGGGQKELQDEAQLFLMDVLGDVVPGATETATDKKVQLPTPPPTVATMASGLLASSQQQSHQLPVASTPSQQQQGPSDSSSQSQDPAHKKELSLRQQLLERRVNESKRLMDELMKAQTPMEKKKILDALRDLT